MAGKRATARQCGAMRSRYRVHEPERAHFVTSTIAGWLPVFTSLACCEILAGSFAYCREHKGLRLYGWVIMENHFHACVLMTNHYHFLLETPLVTAIHLPCPG